MVLVGDVCVCFSVFSQIRFGDRSVTLHLNSSLQFLWLLLVLVPILCFTVGEFTLGRSTLESDLEAAISLQRKKNQPCSGLSVLLLIYRRKQQMLTDRMNRLMENLELDIRNDIRQGRFVGFGHFLPS